MDGKELRWEFTTLQYGIDVSISASNVCKTISEKCDTKIITMALVYFARKDATSIFSTWNILVEFITKINKFCGLNSFIKAIIEGIDNIY